MIICSGCVVLVFKYTTFIVMVKKSAGGGEPMIIIIELGKVDELVRSLATFRLRKT